VIATGSRHKFVGALGHTSEDETGLIYMRARWMDPSLGRFISEDPARDGANWFEYCRGNPVNAVDPDGCSTTALGWIVWLVADLLANMGLPPKLAEIINFVVASKTARALVAATDEALNLLDEIRMASAATGLLDPRGIAQARKMAAACWLAQAVAVFCAAYQILLLFEFVEPNDGFLGLGGYGPFTSS